MKEKFNSTTVLSAVVTAIDHIQTEIEIEGMIADLQILYLIWMILSWNLEMMQMMY